MTGGRPTRDASVTEERPVVTRAGLACVFGLIGAAVSVIALSSAPEAAAEDPSALARTLVAVERPDGGLDLTDPAGRRVDHLRIEGDLFAITALRGVAGRVGGGTPGDRYPLELRETDAGRVSVRDPATGRRLPFEGFGPANRAALARYLEEG